MKDLRGCVVVDRESGRLALVTRRPVDLVGYPAVFNSDLEVFVGFDPVVLGRFEDYLASGRSFASWVKDRGFHGEVEHGQDQRFEWALRGL